jgi:hypothetical protein
VNGWDVLNTFVSAGSAGYIALRVAKAARVHENQQRQHRKRQDGLDKIVDGFEEAHATICALLSLFGTYAAFASTFGEDAARGATSDEGRRLIDAYEKTIGLLSALVGRASMLDMTEIENVLERYSHLRKSAFQIVTFDKLPSKEDISNFHKICDDLERERNNFHAATREAFRGMTQK